MKKFRSSRSFLTILLCNLFLVLTTVFFSPMEVILANVGEFYFPFANVWWFQLLVSLGGALVLTLLFWLLPGRLGLAAAGLSLGVGLAAYVQQLFLNGHMVSLTGERFDIDAAGIRLNLILWCAVVLVVFLAVVLLSRKFRKPAELAMRVVSLALVVMQAVGLFGSYQSADFKASTLRQEHALTAEGEFELSSGQNVVVFVLDTADGTYTQEMLDRWPELNDVLSGFTWYPNALSRYNRTFPSLPYMLTGQDFRFDYPVAEYLDRAYTEGGAFLKGLHDGGVDTRILTFDPELVSTLADPYIDNSRPFPYSAFSSLSLTGLEKVLLRVGLFKCMPYQLKFPFRYDMEYANSMAFRFRNSPDLFYHHLDYEFGRDLKDSMTVSSSYSKAFRFYHLFGTHYGVYWDDNLTPDPDKTPSDDFARVLRGDFRNIEDYIRQMKELGIYDQSTIIITADHGDNPGVPAGETLERHVTAVPILMVKYAGSDLSKPLQINKAPVCHDDLFAVVEQGLSLPATSSGSGKALEDFAEGENRDRFYYFIAYREGNAAEIVLREYLIDGDAADLANYHLTGNNWDIRYSVQKISPEEFTEAPVIGD